MKNIRETQNGFLFCFAYQVILLLLVSLTHSSVEFYFFENSKVERVRGRASLALGRPSEASRIFLCHVALFITTMSEFRNR